MSPFQKSQALKLPHHATLLSGVTYRILFSRDFVSEPQFFRHVLILEVHSVLSSESLES
jgi:hypothetical protein